MKNIVLIMLVVLSLLSLSCEEDFNPKAEFKQKYVLWCVVNSDYRYLESSQVAVLSKLYDVEGYDPMTNREDPVLTGADVRLYVDDFEYLFSQDTTARRDTSRYNTPFVYYRSAPVKFRTGSRFRITAKLPTGEVLISATRLPVNYGFEFSDDYDNGFTTLRDYATEWTVWWDSDVTHIFFPRLRLNYKKYGTDTVYSRSVLVPLSYIDGAPYYGDYTVEQSVTYSFSAIDSAMASISAGDPDKGSYEVTSFVFDLLEYDTPLSNYYSSINGYLDNYSIRLDETVYSNISGGLGVFGSSFLLSRSFSVAENYAKMFGYR